MYFGFPFLLNQAEKDTLGKHTHPRVKMLESLCLCGSLVACFGHTAVCGSQELALKKGDLRFGARLSERKPFGNIWTWASRLPPRKARLHLSCQYTYTNIIKTCVYIYIYNYIINIDLSPCRIGLGSQGFLLVTVASGLVGWTLIDQASHHLTTKSKGIPIHTDARVGPTPVFVRCVGCT